MRSTVVAFISRRWCVPEGLFRVDVEPLYGGLESAVALARISEQRGQRPAPEQLVIKQLPAGFEREADVYDVLWRHLDRPPAVRVFGREASANATYLYLEDARPCSSWPWSDTARSAAVCRTLAQFHDSRELPRECFAWNYEAELTRSAEATLSIATDARDASGKRYWRRLGDLRRVVAALPTIRARLLSGVTTVIHGDMHPGNVILRDGGSDADVVLIDWARARVGSPLEDVASWLHSLGCWEPQARRRHDTLMRAYVEARAVPMVFGADLRLAYWLSSVSNGLSGAMCYHLAVLSDPASSAPAVYDSQRALTAWERVVRRAAALVNTNLNRCM
jgi:aminoglycoside phosphotransferase (APT) family kinase protein